MTSVSSSVKRSLNYHTALPFKQLTNCVQLHDLCMMRNSNTHVRPLYLNLNRVNPPLNVYIHGSVHRNSILIRSNKMQQYAGIYLLQNYSTCFRRPSHPSSGVHKTVTAASGTGHSIWATAFLQRGLKATLEEGCCSDTMTCTRGCSYSFVYSWWWVRWTPETCWVILQ